MAPVLAALLAIALAFPPAPQRPWKPEARSHFDEARKLQEQSMYPFAIDQLQMSLSVEPHPETERALAECFAAIDQPLLASIHLARYVATAPPDAEALNRLGCLQLELAKLEAAAETFRRLEKLDPASAHTGLTQVELKLGARDFAAHKFREARDHYRKALSVSSGDPRAAEGLARSQRALGEGHRGGESR